MSRAVAVLAVAGLAAGCGGTAFPTSTTTSSRLPAGYVRFVDRKDHFSIGVPGSWQQIDPSSPRASGAFRTILRANPGLAASLGSNARDLLTKGVRFFAVKAGHRADASTVNVVVEPAPGVRDADLRDGLNALENQYRAAGATVESTRFVPLAGHEALEVRVIFRFALPTGRVLRREAIQDVVAANDSTYTVSLAGTNAEMRTILSTFDLS